MNLQRVALALTALALAGCPATGTVDIPCRSNANCPSGFGCNPAGVCEKGAGGVSGQVLTISPGVANVAVNATQKFAATVDGAEVQVTWSVEGGGAIATDGTFTAPPAVPTPPQVVVRATRADEAQTSSTATVFLVAQNPLPELTAAAPAALVAGSGDTTLTLTGAGFVSGTTVLVDAASLTPTQASATALTVTVPAAALAKAATLSVKAVNPTPGGGTSAPLAVPVNSPAPSIASVSPASALAGAATAALQVTGAGFTGDTTARLDAVGLTVTARTATLLTLQVAAAQLSAARTATLYVENPAPGGGAANVPFEVQNPAPAITTLAPAAAPAGSAALTVTVTGTGLRPTTLMKVGSTNLATTWVSDTQVTCVVPAASLLTAGVLALVASNPTPGGGDSSAANFSVDNPVPVLQSLSQSAVPVGSAAFTLAANGGGFIGASTIYWGATALTTTFVSAAQLTAQVPSTFLATPATVNVTVVTPAPGGGTTSAQTFRIDNPAPGLTALSATSVAAGSGDLALTLTGTNFVSGSVAYLGATTLGTTFASATSLTATLPAAELATGRQVNVTVQTPGPGGGTSNAVLFTINNPAAALGSLTPGSALSGAVDTPLTINGVGFVAGATVTFGGVSLAATVVSSSQVTTTIPSSLLTRARAVTVTASNPAPAGGALNTLTFRVDAVIRTITGGSGEGGPAARATLNRTYNAVRNPVTNEVYLPQTERHVIWRIDGAGNLQRVAGTGVAGFSGDNGPATSAQVSSPRVPTFDAAGNLYFWDSSNQRLRKVDTAGTITTIAGTGACDGTGDNGLATAAALGDVWGLQFNGSDLYVAQCGCANGHRVRKISGGTITHVAGTAGVGSSTGDTGQANVATLNCPMGLAFDSLNQLYIAEWSGSRVRKVDTAGVITTYAGNGTTTFPPLDNVAASSSSVANPRSIVIDAQDNLFVGAYYGLRIRRVDGVTQNITTLAGTTFGNVSADGTSAAAARIGHPTGLFFDSAGALNFLTVQDSNSELNALLKIDSSGNLQTVAGRSLNTTLANTYFYRPFGVAVDVVGNRYISERENDRILKVDISGAVSVVAGNGTRGGLGDGGPALQAQLNQPEALWLDASGALYFVDAGNSRVRKVDTSGNIATVAGGGSWPLGCTAGTPTTPPVGAGAGYNCIGDDYFANAAVLAGPRFVVGDNAGSLYISEYDTGSAVNRGNRIRKVTLSTGYISTIAGNPALNVNNCTFTGDGAAAVSSTLCAPAGLAVSLLGDLFVADSSNRRIRKINLVSSPVGQINTVAGTGASASTGNGGPALIATFRRPFGLVFDGLGNLVLSDVDSHNVRVIDPGGLISPVAGIGTAGFSGDTGAARDANLYNPAQVAVSANSSLVYIVDWINDRLRVVGP